MNEIHVELYRKDPVALMGVSDAAKQHGGRVVDMSVQGEPDEDQRISLTYAFDDVGKAVSFKDEVGRQYDVATVGEPLPQPPSDKVLPVPGRKVSPRQTKKKLWRKIPWSMS